MHFLATALPALALAAPALGGMLEARQAFPVNGTCQPGEGLAPTDTFGEDALNLLVEELYVRKNASAAFASFFSPGYKQHDPFISGGANPDVKEFTRQWAEANITLLHKGLIANNVSIVHYVYTAPGAEAQQVVDLFAMQAVCVTEHWGVIQTLPPGSDVPSSAHATTGLSDGAGANTTTPSGGADVVPASSGDAADNSTAPADNACANSR